MVLECWQLKERGKLEVLYLGAGLATFKVRHTNEGGERVSRLRGPMPTAASPAGESSDLLTYLLTYLLT